MMRCSILPQVHAKGLANTDKKTHTYCTRISNRMPQVDPCPKSRIWVRSPQGLGKVALPVP